MEGETSSPPLGGPYVCCTMECIESRGKLQSTENRGSTGVQRNTALCRARHAH
jgi:hypothetical protein